MPKEKTFYSAFVWTGVGEVYDKDRWICFRFEKRHNAVAMARKCARDIYARYADLPNVDKPVLIRDDNSVIFKIPGLVPERWPRVDPI